MYGQNAKDIVPSISTEQWLEDVDSLEKWILTKHAKPFWAIQKEAFDTQIELARENVSQQYHSYEKQIVELLKIIASLKDGHSYLDGDDRYALLGYLPFTAAWFEGELYITRAHKKYSQALGSRIVSIDNIPIKKVVERLREVVPFANERRFKKFSPYYLHLPGSLYGLGVIEQSKEATFLLENTHGERFSLLMEHLEEEEKEAMMDLEGNLAELPLYRQQSEKAYWFEYLEEERIVYLKYNRVTSMEEESIWAFSERLFDFIEKEEVEKLVVDIRDNGGGSGAYSASLWKGIQSNPKINQTGKLFVITGYKTFSAAISFASYLELRTQAIFVGEGVCDRLISPGDEEEYALPNTNIRIGLSKLFHENALYHDERITLEPDYPIQISFEDYVLGKDPVMDFIKEFSWEPKNVEILNPTKYVGRYPFSPYQYLDIVEKDGKLWMEILGQMYSPLYAKGEGQFSTEVKDLSLQFGKNGKISLSYPDGKVRVLNKVKNASPSPIELVYAGQFQKLEEELNRLKEEYPEIQYWKDHSLAGLALEAYYDLKDTIGVEKAKATAREVLRIAIRINPEDNEFASYSLRYY